MYIFKIDIFIYINQFITKTYQLQTKIYHTHTSTITQNNQSLQQTPINAIILYLYIHIQKAQATYKRYKKSIYIIKRRNVSTNFLVVRKKFQLKTSQFVGKKKKTNENQQTSLILNQLKGLHTIDLQLIQRYKKSIIATTYYANIVSGSATCRQIVVPVTTHKLIQMQIFIQLNNLKIDAIYVLIQLVEKRLSGNKNTGKKPYDTSIFIRARYSQLDTIVACIYYVIYCTNNIYYIQKQYNNNPSIPFQHTPSPNIVTNISKIIIIILQTIVNYISGTSTILNLQRQKIVTERMNQHKRKIMYLINQFNQTTQYYKRGCYGDDSIGYYYLRVDGKMYVYMYNNKFYRY
eukprot:TRINITY_DN1070_c0_g1_i16.p1 TRINITY_DN1070_c0_g1~~TRINITY_DN1070_c0_g1_i16.p1  ORF type:complete len:348 (+),score=-24.62 TRINITY_DN1070_c0_g1_i16:567-1610(+)